MIFIKLFFITILGAPYHSGHISEYTYSLNKDNIEFMVMLDLDDLEYLNTDKSCDYTSMKAICTSKYIKTNSQLYINKKPIEFDFHESYTKNHHLYIYFNSKTNIDDITNISVLNNCFYKYNPTYKNRIIIDIGSFSGSYLLTEHKNQINLD